MTNDKKTPIVDLGLAIEAYVEAQKKNGGYLPAIATFLRVWADELADRFPDDTNGGTPHPATEADAVSDSATTGE